MPVPTVEFPALLLVQGINLPAPGKPTWDATDLYYVYRERAIQGKRV